MSKEVKISHTNFFDFSKAETEETDDFISKVAKKIANRIDEKGLKELLDKASIYDRLSNELGCPLEVVFKALKNGIFIKRKCFDKVKFIFVPVVLDDYGLGEISNGEIMDYFYLKDYKKTWWLKEDKSE